MKPGQRPRSSTTGGRAGGGWVAPLRHTGPASGSGMSVNALLRTRLRSGLGLQLVQTAIEFTPVKSGERKKAGWASGATRRTGKRSMRRSNTIRVSTRIIC